MSANLPSNGTRTPPHLQRTRNNTSAYRDILVSPDRLQTTPSPSAGHCQSSNTKLRHRAPSSSRYHVGRKDLPDLPDRHRVRCAQHQGTNTCPTPQSSSGPPPRQSSRTAREHPADIPQTLSNLQSVTASLFGITAGILGLESYPGFLFYLVLSAATILLFHALRVAPDARAAGLGSLDTSRYFRTAFSFWGSGFMAGLPGFVLTWTLFYNLVRP